MISFHWNSLKFFLSSLPGWSSSFIKLLYALILASVFIDMWGFIGGSIMDQESEMKEKGKKLCVCLRVFVFFLRSRPSLHFLCCFPLVSCMWWTHKRGIVFFEGPLKPPAVAVMHKFDPCWYADLQKCKRTSVITKGKTRETELLSHFYKRQQSTFGWRERWRSSGKLKLIFIFWFFRAA